MNMTVLAMMMATTTPTCEYGDNSITIDAPQEMVEVVCDGIIDAIDFFDSRGYVTNPLTINMTIKDEVDAVLGNGDTVRVFGQYNALTNLGEISSFGTDYMESRTVWWSDPSDITSGLPVTIDDWQSIVTHETAHQILQEIWSEENPMFMKNGVFLGNGIHEYVAYLVQLTMMDDDARETVLAQYPDITPFEYKQNMNGVLHFTFPHKFGARAFITGDKWLDGIMTGQIVNFESAM